MFKKIVMSTIVITLLLIGSLMVFAEDIDIPDENFKLQLILQGVDTDFNGIISQAEALNVAFLTIDGIGIFDYTGIEYFLDLQQLDIINHMAKDIVPIGLLVKNKQFNGSIPLFVFNISGFPLITGPENGVIHRPDLNFWVGPDFYDIWGLYGILPYQTLDPWLENEIFMHIDDMASDDVIFAEYILSKVNQATIVAFCESGITQLEKIALLQYFDDLVTANVLTNADVVNMIRIFHIYDFSPGYFAPAPPT